jgi:hypothetical protein
VSSIVPHRTKFLSISPSAYEVAQAVHEQLAMARTPSTLANVPTWGGLARSCLSLYNEAIAAHNGAAA